MRFTTRLRTAPGIWLAPLVALVFIMVDQNASSEPYWLAQVFRTRPGSWSPMGYVLLRVLWRVDDLKLLPLRVTE